MYQEDKKMCARIRYGYDCNNFRKIAPKNCRSQKKWLRESILTQISQMKWNENFLIDYCTTYFISHTVVQFFLLRPYYMPSLY